MKSPDRLDSRKLEKYTAASLVTDLAFEKRGRSQVQKAVDRACSAEANVVPKDGMRYALASQTTRLQNRLSLQLSEEEKVLLTARRALLDSIHREYSALQQNTVHGRTMEPQKD